MITRTPIALAGLLLALAGTVWWAASGAHAGWTKTSVAMEKTDEVTGIAYREYEKRFVPGLEIAAGSIFAGAVLVGAGFWRQRRITRASRK